MRLVRLTFLLTAISASLIIDNYTRSVELSKFVSNIITKDCGECKTILVINTNQERSCDLFLKNISTDFNLYTVAVDGLGSNANVSDNNVTVYPPDLTVIFLDVDVYDSLEAVVFTVEILPYWNVRGKFLIIPDGDKIDDEFLDEWLKNTFESFWERQALLVLVSLYLDDTIVSYTYDPFKEDYRILVSANQREYLWFDRRIRDMNGAPIKLYQFDTVLVDAAVKKITPDNKETWVGTDGIFFSVLAETLNASLMVHGLSEDFSENMVRDADPSTPLSQYLNLFADLFDFDLLFNRMQTFSDNELDKIFLYERDDLRIIVPRTGTVPKYLSIILLVSGDVWAATILSLAAVVVARKLFGGKFASPVLDNLTFLLGTAPPHRSHAKSPEKILLVLWMLSCVVLTALFQTTLMSTLVVPRYYPDMDTLEQLINTDMTVYGAEYTNLQLSRIIESNQDKKFMSRVLDCPRNVTVYGDNIEWIDLYMKNHGVILTQEQTYRRLRTDKTIKRTHHVMAESPMPNAVSYNIPRAKFYYTEVQRCFSTIQEAGLHIYWRNYDYFLDKSTGKSNITKTTESEDEQVLTLVHLQSAFLLLHLGLFGALLIFCCEINCKKNKKHNSKKKTNSNHRSQAAYNV